MCFNDSNFQWISKLSDDQIENLIKSFDTFLFDIDGTLLRGPHFIEGSDLTIKKLRKLGKKIGFVTDNTVVKLEDYEKFLAPFNFNSNELETPVSALLDHLKKINYQKDIYVMASENVKKSLKAAGYKIITAHDDILSRSEVIPGGDVPGIPEKIMEICKNVGLVYVDLCPDYNYVSIQSAYLILKYIKDSIFITGTPLDLISVGLEYDLIGMNYIIKNLEQWSNKKSMVISKSGNEFKHIINNKFHITDPSRVLMIGDTLEADIVFGIKAGFKTCLVLSGTSTRSDLSNLKENFPNFVAENLGEFGDKIIEK